jgi:Tol biopolymer transport system component
MRFDWAMIGLSILFAGGLWIDGWAHFHGKTDNTFFTPWHFLFYSAFGLVVLFLGFNHLRNLAKGYRYTHTLPIGYRLSLIGAVIFGVGGIGDMIWHILFGIEGGTEALTSPTHLTLGVGMALVWTGPLRAAWLRFKTHEAADWRRLGPAIIAATLLFSLMAFFTSYDHPIAAPLAALASTTKAPTTAQLYTMNMDGSLLTRLTRESFGAGSLAIAPDRERIVYEKFNSNNNQNVSSNLYLINIDGTHVTQLTNEAGDHHEPAWSPDGKLIAYTHRMDNGKHGLYVINADGSGSPKAIDTGDADVSILAWSPDSKQIAFTVQGPNDDKVTLINVDDSEQKTLSVGGSTWNVGWSPDGASLVVTSQQNGGFNIYRINTDGSARQRLSRPTPGDNQWSAFSSFSPDGKHILFLSNRTGHWEAYEMPVTGEPDDSASVSLSHDTQLEVYPPVLSLNTDKMVFVAQPQRDSGVDLSSQDYGVTGILVGAAIMMGIVLLLVWRWKLPFGTFAVMFVVNAALLSVLNDTQFFIPAAFIAGLIADGLAWWLKAGSANPVGFQQFAFIAPIVYFALYFLTIQLVAGVHWHIHVWAGAIFLSGVIGLLLSFLIVLSVRGDSAAEAVAAPDTA